MIKDTLHVLTLLKKNVFFKTSMLYFFSKLGSSPELDLVLKDSIVYIFQNWQGTQTDLIFYQKIRGQKLNFKYRATYSNI